MPDFYGANLREAKVSDEEIADCNILYGATMPEGNRYDGRFSLEGDIALAREESINTDDSSAMARWYARDDPTPGGGKRARRGRPIMIVAIIASAVVVLACIVASAFMAHTFIQQALWYVYG